LRTSWLIVAMGSPSSNSISEPLPPVQSESIELVFIFLQDQIVKAILAYIEKINF